MIAVGVLVFLVAFGGGMGGAVAFAALEWRQARKERAP